jgi:hypothetical protein
MELWVESHDYVAEIERLVFSQTPQPVVLHGFEKSWSLENKEVDITYHLKQVNFLSAKVWGIEVIDYTAQQE